MACLWCASLRRTPVQPIRAFYCTLLSLPFRLRPVQIIPAAIIKRRGAASDAESVLDPHQDVTVTLVKSDQQGAFVFPLRACVVTFSFERCKRCLAKSEGIQAEHAFALESGVASLGRVQNQPLCSVQKLSTS